MTDGVGDYPAATTPDLSDYALRHPELLHPAAPDLSDWYLRHRGATDVPVQPDLSDYALRHPGMVPPAAR